ncbi:MAG TPA: exodeoxyribonuclease III [Candidatus Hydrogenedentes bacterium]|nr:exodeoxyribonuclease III [Candidatus Hydrogenedentota bacterium]
MTVIYSWNVNGLRAALKNGLMDWFAQTQPDILCLQETRLLPDEAPPELQRPDGYHVFWNPAEKRGYSGTAVFTKTAPLRAATLGIPEFDCEGRAQLLTFSDFTLVNTYWPNSQDERKRLAYKLAFCEAIGQTLDALVRQGRHVIICGDFNIAHREIDLARPKANENNAGYYIEEREAMTAFLARGYVDVFRCFHPDAVAYTWWSYRARARKRNIGWRLDYHCVDKSFLSRVKDIIICNDIYGSDHCPVALTLDKAPPGKKRTAP